jgi:hypothetical protein
MELLGVSQLGGERGIEARIEVATDFTSKGYEKEAGRGARRLLPPNGKHARPRLRHSPTFEVSAAPTGMKCDRFAFW